MTSIKLQFPSYGKTLMDKYACLKKISHGPDFQTLSHLLKKDHSWQLP